MLDSRPIDDGASIKRRRECPSCGKRFTTYEVVDTVPIAVVKRDGRHEFFDKHKLVRGLQISCQKRPVNAEGIATSIEQELSSKYEHERKLNLLITIFSLISICISLMGVFGLVFFETQYRRREIAVRRVHGAKIGQILQMFVGQYAKMVLVAFLFAVPVSYLIMWRWL